MSKNLEHQKAIHFLFTSQISDIRLDKALASDPRILSRSQATSLIDRGFVTLNGKTVKPAHKTVVGEEYSVVIPNEEPLELLPYEFALDILFEDDHLLVLNKPSGLVVHPAAGHRQQTLVNALVHHTKDLAAGFAAGRPGIVHRIDKDTSGLLVIAKSERALRGLAKQFKMKTVHRIYWVVSYGLFKTKHGTITSYIGRHPGDRKKFASLRAHGNDLPKGKLAITHYDVQMVHPSGLSLIHCKLETGRTHQIRVHLSEMEHPIVGDPIYCTAHRVKSLKSGAIRKLFETIPHLMLHAAELGFTHPITGEVHRFSVPWPRELQPYLQTVGFLPGAQT